MAILWAINKMLAHRTVKTHHLNSQPEHGLRSTHDTERISTIRVVTPREHDLGYNVAKQHDSR